IPFANRLIHRWFVGAQLLRMSRGIQLENQRIAGQSATQALRAAGVASGNPEIRAVSIAAQLGRYFIPIHSTWTMRMQSNLFRAVERCAVDQ
ncbi:MAG: pilus assembly protein, partial [Myxococcales bacterium]